jgi:hypothetical protein
MVTVIELEISDTSPAVLDAVAVITVPAANASTGVYSKDLQNPAHQKTW